MSTLYINEWKFVFWEHGNHMNLAHTLPQSRYIFEKLVFELWKKENKNVAPTFTQPQLLMQNCLLKLFNNACSGNSNVVYHKIKNCSSSEKRS